MLYRYGLARISGVSFTAAEQAVPFQVSGMLRADVPVYSVVEGSTDFMPGDRERARCSSGMTGCPALLWVGRLNSNKDPLTILEAVSIAAREFPALQLWCAFHEAPLLKEVCARIESDPWLVPRVHLLGKQTQKQIQSLCQAADLFVLGSQEEGSGYALLEAMACGLPAVVSDIPPFRKITGAGRCASLVERGNARAFAAAIKMSQERQQSREAVRRHFDENLAYSAIGRQLVDVYRDLLGRAT
jgi:glycosyltransferase involved in cell wall biosynthesis